MDANLKNTLAGRTVIANVSGGKDSTAMCLWFLEQDIPFEPVHQLTGWDNPVTLDYLRGDLARVLGPITEIRGPRLMRDLILHKGMFPSRQIRFCTRDLKIQPMQRYLRERDDDFVNAIGIRSDESRERAGAVEWEWSDTFDCEVWRPILAWTVDDVIAIHKRHNLRPNPLYLQGAERVGCWPCINSRKSEIRLLAITDPARIDEIEALEKEVGEAALDRWHRDRKAWTDNPPPEPDKGSAAWEKWEATRARLFDRELNPPTFFQDSAPNASGRYKCVPIRKVVEWSMTKRGGKQFELFAGHTRDDGCVRWGMCEQPSREPE